MKPFKSFELPQNVLDIVGEEWKGKYIVYTISAKEYRTFLEELIQSKRVSTPDWDGNIQVTDVQEHILRKTVKLNDKDLPIEMPSKLYDLLFNIAIPLNMSTPAEAKALFLGSSPTSQTESR